MRGFPAAGPHGRTLVRRPVRRLRRDTLWRQVAWGVHRASGLGVLAFLVLHVADTSLVILDPAAYNTVVNLYRQPFFDGIEIVLIGPLIFHAVNGLRIVIQDLWPGWVVRQRQMLQATYAVTVFAWVLFGYFMVVNR